MEFEHRPVLLVPTVDALLLPGFGGKGAARSNSQTEPDTATRAERGVFVDGTFGRGGHSRELLGRLGEAARLLLDRQLPGGGWNYGNTRVFGRVLQPVPESAGHALAALAGRVADGAVAPSLGYLQSAACAVATPLAAAWRALGLGAWGLAGEAEMALIDAALSRQSRYGPYDTPLLAQCLVAAVTGGRFSLALGAAS